MKLRARFWRFFPALGAAVTLAAFMAAACSVPDFQFDPAAAGGDGNTIAHCQNGLLDTDLGETDFDCGGGCPPCDEGRSCLTVADCVEGLLCHDASCLSPGCTNRAQDGSESDVDCGGDCKACVAGQTCVEGSDCDSTVCSEGKCQAPACDDRALNGKETGMDCGGDCEPCPGGQPCAVDGDCVSGACHDQVCGPQCADGYADCNSKNDDDCEVSIRTDVDNCGRCGKVCDLAHAAAECSAGECRIQDAKCADGYADCNGLPEDGCEVDLLHDKLNCGVCNKACPAINGAPFCDAGACQITCAQGFEDCDDTRENGCEKDVSKDVNNCGRCTEKCVPQSGGTPYCKDGGCGETICPAGYGDCNGSPDDGCEVDLRIDAKNCNTCGNLCLAANGTATCSNRVCKISGCDKGFDDCKGGYADGCETNTTSDIGACGGCGKPCTVSNGVAKCDAGTCSVGSCGGTYRDCDGDVKTGCEVDIASSTKSCGGCGTAGSDCSSKYDNASSVCSGSACTAPTCKPGFEDCDSDPKTGCETDVTRDPSNCGACKLKCASTNTSSPPICSAGVCKPSCSDGWGACSKPELGCTTPLGTSTDCTACGVKCTSPNIFCEPTGCTDHRDLVIVNSATHAVGGFGGSAPTFSDITLMHALGTAADNNRMVLVGVVAGDNFTNPESIVVSYAGTPMLNAIKQEDSAKHVFAGIYYLLDSALPAGTGTNAVTVRFGGPMTWGMGGANVVELKNAMQVKPIATAGAPGADCSSSIYRPVSVTYNQPGSLVLGLLGARNASAVTLESLPNQTQIWSEALTSPDKLWGAAAYAWDDNDHTMTWDVSSCYYTAAVLAVIQRLNAN